MQVGCKRHYIRKTEESWTFVVRMSWDAKEVYTLQQKGKAPSSQVALNG